ncbi:Oidioi.mRNA.OKI2018_I69.PAR.g10776.t1.cds [Oikopleura dioica]|uniref:Oidioi.mRNA.OKI2018_I69.PAR.g10776.t1.cds n=1 Tax=Oikopleura dioica TaxID=34765 RepID=A0ABN7RXJ1_OIKDI|nr:Oidioi.mRNA.OKI2018_I69.PAR.g10776.t1.cds [Oikopleura dioica]
MDELPKKVDFVVCGTGLPCSIFAAACARIGKSVLQIDRNTFYGSEWSNFNMKEAKSWKASCESSKVISNLKFTPSECWDTFEMFLRTEQYRFNINVDNSPLFSTGKMTELLIQSKATRYLSFKNVASLKTVYEDEFMSVPASRADLFASKRVTVIEKRKMMNFLTKSLQEEPSEEISTFDQFLERFKLTEKLKSFVKSSIIFSNTEDLSLYDGLAKLKKFISSLGKYSAASAFLYASYGSGELAQAFARMCAVFGGITVLEYPLKEIFLEDDLVTSLSISVPESSTPHKVRCDHMIAEVNYLESYHNNTEEDFHQVIIILTDDDLKKIIKDEKLALAEDSGPEPDHCIITAIVDGHHIWGLALDSSSSTTPKGKSIVTLRCRHKPTLDKFSSKFATDSLWQMEFTNSKVHLNDLPANVQVSPTVQFDPDYDYAVSWAENLFKKLCPEEEWLPPMPEPGDIIFPTDEEGEKKPEDPKDAEESKDSTAKNTENSSQEESANAKET